MIEIPLYPYEVGRFGIPFKELFTNIAAGSVEGETFGGSGRTLWYELNQSPNLVRLGVYDHSHHYYGLESTLHVPTLTASFDLHTKILPMDFQFGAGHTRHPDLFARKFIGVALAFYQNLGYEILRCEAYWVDETKKEHSDTYQQFINEFKRTGNKVEAARITWTGQALATYGFSEITDDDVQIIQTPDINEVYAYFHRA